jgi:hypothetical protein
MIPAGIPYFKAWLIFLLVSTLLAMGVGMAVGMLIGVVLGIAQVDLLIIQRVCAAIGFVLGLVVSYSIFRWVIDRYVVPAVRSAELTTN